MSGAATALSPAELEAGFASFVAAAQRLEQRYVELKARAAAIDLELRDKNAALAATLEERERLLASLPVGVLSFTAAGALSWHNELAQRFCGAQAHEACGWPEGEREVAELRLRVRRAAMAGGATLVLVEDRSQLARLEREVDRLDRLAGLSELAMGIAHEIKNPLNGVLGFAELLQRAASDDNSKRYAQRVIEGVWQVDAIVRELLAFARPGRAASRLLSLRDASLEAAAQVNLPQARLELRGAVDAVVEGAALVRVLANLLRNAAEAGGDAVRVTVEANRRGQGLVIVVRDDGPGVPHELAERLFEPFVSSKPRGTGLGLALATRVLGYLGGTLRLLNPGERGAAFAIELAKLPEARDGQA